jgi:hypothetical protein
MFVANAAPSRLVQSSARPVTGKLTTTLAFSQTSPRARRFCFIVIRQALRANFQREKYDFLQSVIGMIQFLE